MFFLVRNRGFMRNAGICSQVKIHILYSSVQVFPSLPTNYITQFLNPWHSTSFHWWSSHSELLAAPLNMMSSPMPPGCWTPCFWLGKPLLSFLCLISVYPSRFPPLWACPPHHRWHESLSLPHLNMALIICPAVSVSLSIFFPPAATTTGGRAHVSLAWPWNSHSADIVK